MKQYLRLIGLGVVATLLTACQMEQGSYEQRVVTGIAAGALVGAVTGDERNIIRGAIVGGAASALTYGRRPNTAQADCRRRYAGNTQAIQSCQRGVQQGQERQARQFGNLPNTNTRDCYRRYQGSAATVCARTVQSRQAREQRQLEAEARRTGQRIGYGG